MEMKITQQYDATRLWHIKIHSVCCCVRGASLPGGSGARPDPLEPEFDQALVIARFLRTANPSPARPIAKTA